MCPENSTKDPSETEEFLERLDQLVNAFISARISNSYKYKNEIHFNSISEQ